MHGLSAHKLIASANNRCRRTRTVLGPDPGLEDRVERANLHVLGAAADEVAGDHKEPAEPRQTSNDFLDHPAGRVFLLGIATHVCEGKHRKRRLFREGKSWPCGRSRSHQMFARGSIDADTLRDVLKLLFTVGFRPASVSLTAGNPHKHWGFVA